ncbi:hypothetical protein GIB67_013292, partial [Kingdonia uniflora]
EPNGTTDMDDPESTMATVAHFVEKLHANMSSPHEKELITARLLGIARARKDARALIGSHAQAMPLFISVLRTRKAAAEAIFEVSSGGLSDDHVGMKIFVTEGVVSILWDQLNPKIKQDRVVEGFVTGALRNLCGDKDGYWRATLDAGGVDIIVGLLSSDNAAAQSNAASLLARLMLAFPDSIPKVIDAGAVKALLRLVGYENDISVRASAADALEALSSKSPRAKKVIVDADGIPIFIGVVVAPSKECMQGESGHTLQGHAIRALANVTGGMAALIIYLGELSQSPRLAAPVADIIGALAYSLMIFEKEEPIDVAQIEDILLMLLKPRDNKLVQERVLEALASLYGNSYLSKWLNHSDTKRVLIGLITMASSDVQEYLIISLTTLCCDGVGIWEALEKREGVQLLISFLGLSSEQHQEYAVELLAILTDQVDDSKWAITAAGGIPPLVQLLEMGSQKAREDAAHVLWNLCCHSADIRVCVESAGAVPAFLWLLRSGGTKGQEASAMALTKLIRSADAATINQLLALLLAESPRSKTHIIKVLGHVLTMASHKDLVQKGAPANKGLRSLVEILNSSNEETQDKTQGIATQSARALGALSRPTQSTIKSKNKKSYISEGDVKPLISLAKTSSIETAETAVAALANLLSDPHIAAEALAEDIVSALTRVLGEGTIEGKKNASRALHQLLNHFSVGDVLSGNAQCRFTVLSLADSLSSMDINGIDSTDALDPLVHVLAEGSPLMQDKAIEILSRLCNDQPVVLGDLLVGKPKSLVCLTNRIMNSPILEVKVGSAALLICAAKEHKSRSIDALEASGFLKPLIYALVDMMKRNSGCSSLEIEVRTPRGYTERTIFQDNDDFGVPDPATVLGGTVALWLLSIISSFHAKNRVTVMEAGGVEALSDKLASCTANPEAEFEDTEGIWISSLLLAILFQDANVVQSPTTMRIIPSLAILLRSDEVIDRYFAAQAMASLVCGGSKGIHLAIANSGAVAGLITLIGYIESDMPNLVALSEEFSLVCNPDQVVLDHLFEIEDVRSGSTGRKSIPLLVDLLRPIPDRPGAPPVAVRLLTHIANGSDMNKLAMADAGALDALTKYLSLSPQDSTETIIAELLRILFSNPDLLHHEASLSSLNQLIAVLRLGSKSARFSAARALHELFDAENIKKTELARHALQPLFDMLNCGSERELQATLVALIKLTYGNSSIESSIADVEGNPLEILYKILSSTSSLDLKTDAALLCLVMFGNSKLRRTEIASECIKPLISLMQSEASLAIESGVCALNILLDDEQQLEVAAEIDIVDLLVGLVSRSNLRITEASIQILIKLGKDRTHHKLHMVKAGVIDTCLDLLSDAPGYICSSIAELFRIITNSSAVARSSAAAKVVEPLFLVLLHPDFSLQGQHSALQALVNILEKPQSLTTLRLTPSEIIETLIIYLESPSQAIQQLGTELLSHLLAQEHFQQDITTQNAVVPLVQLAGIGILSLQLTAIKALESISSSWPKAVADAGSNAEYCFKVPLVVLVRMLNSVLITTVSVALNALIVQERTDACSAELMAEAGAIDALLGLLRSHKCEEASGSLLEALFNNVRVREMKVSKYAIAPLSQYLLDPQTQSQPGRLLAALALGDLFQQEGLARARDSVSACRALISLLEDQPTDDMRMVAICALQNLVMHSRTNRRAVAEAGGILVIQELLLSTNSEVAGQAALLIKFLFSNHTLQEYVSNELIRSLAAALRKDEWLPATITEATITEEVLRTLNVIFSNFPKLLTFEAATLCIPLLIGVVQAGSVPAQESALNILCLLKYSWPTMSIDMAKSQAMIAAEAIPTLQLLMKTCPTSFHERVDSLLHCLPGCLTVTIMRGNNLKQTMGSTNAFCTLTLGNGPPRQTKVVNHNNCPEWKEGFTWAFDVPPKGQKLHILCKSKNTFGKTTLGRVTIQIDKVVTEGIYSGLVSLNHEHKKDGSHQNKDGSSRSLEIEITWSNSTYDGSV